MEPNSAAASPEPTQTATTEPAAPALDDFGFPTTDPLSTEEMSDEQIEALVDQTLGLKGSARAPQVSNEAAPAAGAGSAGATPPENAGSPAVNDPSGGQAPPVPAAQQPVAPPPTPEPEQQAQPIEVPTLDTSDLWIEVKNSDGDTVRLTLDDGVPDDFMFANDKQLYEVLDSFQEMKTLRGDREATIADAQAKKAEQEAKTVGQQSQMNGWANEIDELVEAGMIPASNVTPANGQNFTEAEINGDPGLKLTNDVFTYMKQENTKRAGEGKAPLTSFAAAFVQFNKASTEAVAEQKAKDDLVKKRGGLVGGSSGPGSGSEKGYVYKRGSARNIWQVDTSDI